MALEKIIPFLKPLEHLIYDRTVSEIMINGPQRIFVERDGELEQARDIAGLSDDSLQAAMSNLARPEESFDERHPILEKQFPDGSRITAVHPSISLNGTSINIRKFVAKDFTVATLVAIGSITREAAETIQSFIRERKNVIFSGGTGTGKTTLLNIFSDAIDESDRVLVDEDTPEINLRKPHVLRFRTRKGYASGRREDDIKPITIRDLIRMNLRQRPDRIIVGEVRGGEAYDLLQALSTGHSGLGTVHANSAEATLSRLEHLVAESGMELTERAIRSKIAECIHLIVYVERRHAKRYVSKLLEVLGYSFDTNQYTLRTLYTSTEPQMKVGASL